MSKSTPPRRRIHARSSLIAPFGALLTLLAGGLQASPQDPADAAPRTALLRIDRAALEARLHGWEAAGNPVSTPAGHRSHGVVLAPDGLAPDGLEGVVNHGDHGEASSLAEGFHGSLRWRGAGAVPRLTVGVASSARGTSPRGGLEVARPWEWLLVYEPASSGTRDGWSVAEFGYETGAWRIVEGDAGSSAMTLAELAGSAEPVGARTAAELFAAITAPGSRITSIGLGLGGSARGNLELGELSLSAYLGGATVSFTAGSVTNVDTGERFTSIQAAIDDSDTLDGHTLDVAAGTYTESVTLGKRLTMLGAQAGSTAVGRVVGSPSSLTESIVAPPSGAGLTLLSGAADAIVDGFTFLDGTRGIETASGPLDGIALLNNHFEGQSGSNVRLAHDAVNATIAGNALLSGPSAEASLHLGLEDFDGVHVLDNLLDRDGGRTAAGLSAGGNNNLGASGLRSALIAQNVFEGHTVGLDLGSRAFFGGDILQNRLSDNDVGLGFGVQSSTIADNVFVGNLRAIHFSSLGSTSPLRGAFDNSVIGNQIVASALSGVLLDDAQAPGTIGTNAFASNCFEGNALAIEYAGTETVAAEDNWWGDASGPSDPVGTNPAVNGSCPAVPLINAGGLGDAITGDALDYCPWNEEAVCQTLSLTAADCQDDAYPGEAGVQVEVELWMLDLASVTTGFQAFLVFDDLTLAYRGDLSTYSATPFPLHVQAPLTAEVMPGRLRLDASSAFGAPGATADALLATLVFDVVSNCSITTVDFDLTAGFPSTLSYVGYPLPTRLLNTPGFTLDGVGPTFDPYADVTVAADASSTGGCAGAVVAYPTPSVTDNCPGAVALTCTPASGSFFPVGTTTVTCTATDVCGHVTVLTFDVTVTATNLVDVTVELPGVTGPATRCVRFQLDSCAAPIDLSLAFGAGFPASVTTTLEVPCGVYTELCAKDQQHTLWDSSALQLSLDGTRYELAAGPLSLAGGDTDDDGDVDIDDVTWFLAQFGGLAVPGGCPWSGARDADFDLNGAIGSEDYTFLSANWLSLSACPSCPLTAGGGGSSKVVRTALDRRADLDRNGTIDHLDVALFEDSLGLPRELSTRMRDSAVERQR